MPYGITWLEGGRLGGLYDFPLAALIQQISVAVIAFKKLAAGYTAYTADKGV